MEEIRKSLKEKIDKAILEWVEETKSEKPWVITRQLEIVLKAQLDFVLKEQIRQRQEAEEKFQHE